MTDSLNARLGRRVFALLAGVLVLGAAVTCSEQGRSPVAPDGLPAVDARVAIAASRDTARMLIGTTLQLSSTVLNPQGHELPNKEHSSWMSSNPAVATVDTTGLVTAIDSGHTFVVALYKKTADSVRVHVVPVPVARVVITPATLTLEVGQSAALVATTLDSIGGVLSGRRIEWSSSSTNVAAVDATGIVTGQHEGTAWIRAASEGKSDSTAATVEVPHLSVVTGPPASGTVGAALPQPLVVRVTLTSGRPIQGRSVVFALVSGGGTLSPSSAVTDADGRASTQWVLGTTAGRDSATASVTGADPLGFGVDALAGEPAHVTYVSGSGQTGMIGQPLAQPLVVRATDQYGNVVRSVQWSSAAGNPLQDSVAANGNLYATWTVTRAGADTALALAGSDTARFIATGSPAGPPTLTLASEPAPPFTVAEATRVNVVLRDANAAPVPGATVTWTVASGSGSFSDIFYYNTPWITTKTTLTDANGSTGTDWYPGRLVGPNTLDVRAPGADPLTVSVTSTAAEVCQSGINRGTGTNEYIGSGMVGTILPTVLTPYAYDAWGNVTTGGLSLQSVPDGGEVIWMSDGTFRIRLGTRAGDVRILYFGRLCLGSAGPYWRMLIGSLTATATPGPASRIAIAGGNNQNGIVGTVLSVPLTVTVADQYGNATSGDITWAVTNGGGSVTGSGSTAHWALGTTGGAQSVTATLGNGASVAFHATALGVGSTIAIVSGDGQTAAPGTALPATLVVQVTDGNGNPTSGVTITWSITAGGGTIFPLGDITDASGRAWARWTLGPTPGQNGASASVIGTTLTVNFTASGN